MKIITCITDPNQVGYVHALKASCDYFQLELITLIIDKYVSHRQKTKRLRKYLETTNPDELIFFTDGYDTILLAGEEEILQKYHKLSPIGKMLMSADRFCASGPLLPELFKSTKYGYNYICSGGFIGKAGIIAQNIDKMYDEMKNHTTKENNQFIWCDQYEWTQAMLGQKIDLILDHNCEIFQTFTSVQSVQNLYEFVNSEPPLSEDEDLYTRKSVVDTIKAILEEVEITDYCRVYNKTTKTYPIQIHYNSKINKLVMFMEPFVKLVDKVN